MPDLSRRQRGRLDHISHQFQQKLVGMIVLVVTIPQLVQKIEKVGGGFSIDPDDLG